MSGTISRQAAIDAVIKADYEFTGILSEPRARMFEQTINALPPAQPDYTDDQIQKMQDLEQAQLDKAFELGRKNAKWIPCSERLPKIGKEVLLSEPNDMFIAEYYGSGLPEGVWRVDGIDHYLQDIKGCAWMPLPDPYREEGE